MSVMGYYPSLISFAKDMGCPLDEAVQYPWPRFFHWLCYKRIESDALESINS